MAEIKSGGDSPQSPPLLEGGGRGLRLLLEWWSPPPPSGGEGGAEPWGLHPTKLISTPSFFLREIKEQLHDSPELVK